MCTNVNRLEECVVLDCNEKGLKLQKHKQFEVQYWLNTIYWYSVDERSYTVYAHAIALITQ